MSMLCNSFACSMLNNLGLYNNQVNERKKSTCPDRYTYGESRFFSFLITTYTMHPLSTLIFCTLLVFVTGQLTTNGTSNYVPTNGCIWSACNVTDIIPNTQNYSL